MIDKASAAVVEQGGMPSGDDAEEALKVVAKYIVSGVLTLPPGLAVQMPNIHRCLVAFLALMRMHEAKQLQEPESTSLDDAIKFTDALLNKPKH